MKEKEVLSIGEMTGTPLGTIWLALSSRGLAAIDAERWLESHE